MGFKTGKKNPLLISEELAWIKHVSRGEKLAINGNTRVKAKKAEATIATANINQPKCFL